MTDTSPHSESRDALLDQIMASKAFSRIPRANLKKIISRIEMMPVEAGETIIRHGEVGDCFYIIRTGKCRVIGYMSVEDDTVEMATLGPGDSFGEEALIRGTPRSANIEMLTDGTIARLNKDDFVELVQKALLRGVDVKTAEEMISGGAKVIDIRPSVEFGNFSIRGSRSIPLDFLRRARRNLDADSTYIVCSDSELESALGAFLLAQMGYDACYLDLPVGDFLRESGQCDADGVMLLDQSAEAVIDLPEEFSGVGEDRISIDQRGSNVAISDSTAVSRTTDVHADIEHLRHEMAREFEAQQTQFREELARLKEQVKNILDANAKVMVREFLGRISALEGRIAALEEKEP